MRELLGTGWAYPVTIDAVRGRVAMANGDEDIRQAMNMILLTAPGERMMRPEFGCRIHELIFAPFNPTTVGQVMRFVEEALARWEPRIEVRAVRVNPAPHAPERLVIEIDYQIKATMDERTLVFPFYRIPEEEDTLEKSTLQGGRA